MKVFHQALLSALLLSGITGFSQGFKCGTVVPPSAFQYMQQMQTARVSTIQNYTNCINKEISLNIIIVSDSLNNVNGGAIPGGVATLNSHFDSICLSFKVCNIDTVYAYKYYRWDIGLDHAEFVTNYAKENVINIALVGKIYDPPDAAGYAPLGVGPSGSPHKDLIVFNAGSFSGKTILHEFGHYFGLYHTFETGGGVELVDGSNCATAGDFICDTPADIDPAPLGPGCSWAGSNTDPNGDYYTPLLGNIMSYHQGPCPNFFTMEQYNQMVFSYLNFRNYLY